MGDLGSFLSIIGDVLGIGSGIKGLTGSGGGTQPTTGDTSAANTAFQQFMQNLALQMNSQLPQIMQGIGQGMSGLAGLDTSAFWPASARVSSQYGDLATGAANTGNALNTLGWLNTQAQNRLMGAGDQLWQTAQDPQSALYQRAAQQVQDQARASSTSRGLGMTPYAAGLENQAMSNFNIDWQNQQLARMLSGLQGMGQAYGQGANLGNLAGRDVTSGMDISQMVPGFTAASVQAPFQLQTQAAGWPAQLASQYGGLLQSNVYGPEFQFLQQMIPYIYAGQGASAQNFLQNQTNLSNMIGGFGSLGNLFGGMSGSGGGSTQPFPYQSFYSQQPANQFNQPISDWQSSMGFASPGAGA